jgi:hypothetical protein
MALQGFARIPLTIKNMKCFHSKHVVTQARPYQNTHSNLIVARNLLNTRITLKGRIWKVMCETTVQQQYKGVKLRDGWMNFAEDNRLILHDQLLFTHVAEGRFLVQIVAKGHRGRGRPRLYRPDHSPGISGKPFTNLQQCFSNFDPKQSKSIRSLVTERDNHAQGI